MSESTVEIRPAGEDDLASVAELCRAWEAEDITRCYRADTPAELRPRLDGYFLVAESAGQVVGFVVAEPRPTEGSSIADGVFSGESAYLEVQDLYVAAAHRNSGIGGRLMRSALDCADQRGVSCSMVYSANRDYARTARFYESCGYEMWQIFLTRKKE